jgi:hypothetical protein
VARSNLGVLLDVTEFILKLVLRNAGSEAILLKGKAKGLVSSLQC